MLFMFVQVYCLLIHQTSKCWLKVSSYCHCDQRQQWLRPETRQRKPITITITNLRTENRVTHATPPFVIETFSLSTNS